MAWKVIILACLVLLLAACNLNSAPTVIPSTRVAQLPTSIALPTQSASVTPRPQLTAAPTSGGGGSACTPRADWTIVYTVVAGDTMSGLAVRTNSTVNELTSGNCLSDPNAISVGQRLRVPRTPQALPPPTATFRPPLSQNPPPLLGSINISSIISADAGHYMLLRDDIITLRWDGVPADAARVTFWLLPGGWSWDYAGPGAQAIGEDYNVLDGALIQWKVPGGLGTELVAFAYDSSGGIRAYSASQDVASAPPKAQNCEISAAQGHTLAAYNAADANSGLYMNEPTGKYYEVMGRTVHGWYVIDVPQIPDSPFNRLKYVPSQSVLYGRGNCAGIPPEPQPGQMATFTNSIVGITIDYPMGWSAVMQGNFITLTGTNGDAFEVLYLDAGQTSPPQDEANSCKSLPVCIGNRSVTSEGAVTLPSGIIGYRMDLSGDPVKGLGPAVYTFTIISNRNMVLRGFGNLTTYNTILNTVRPG